MKSWLACAIAAALAVAPAAAAAADRLDRAAAALERASLYVHPDLLWLVPARDRERLTVRLRGAAAPIRVVVLPLVDEDESGGQIQRATAGIRERVGRPGFYVVMGQSGAIDVQPPGLGITWGLPAEGQAVERLLAAIGALRVRRPESARGFDVDPAPLIDLGERSEVAPWRDGLIAAGIGLVAGGLAFGVASLAPVAVRRGRRGNG